MTKSVDLLKEIVSLKPGGEVREQQHTAVSEIESALLEETNLLLEAPTGSGKALLTSTPILTTKGWSTMGELVEGDLIYGTDGKTTKVIKAHEPFLSKELYSVEFSNGETIAADSDHLWNVEAFGKHLNISANPKDVDSARLAELEGKVLRIMSGEKETPLENLQPVLSLYPREVLLRAIANSAAVAEDDTSISITAHDFLENLYQELLGHDSTWRTGDMAKAYEDPMNDPMTFTVKRNQPLVFEDEVTSLPVPSRFYGEWLSGSEDSLNAEHVAALEARGLIASNMILDEYFSASVTQRNQLLLGIYKGEETGEFHTTSQVLAEDIQFLIATLGRTSTFRMYAHEDKKVFVISLNPASDDSEKVGAISPMESAMVRCITVDAEDHLFLAGKQLIPTHNTLSYLIPLIENDSLAVVSTATKQLSEQIMGDIEFLNSSLKKLKSPKRADATLLKGRDNYLCLAKFDEVLRLEDKGNTLFGMADGGTSELSDRANKMVSETKALSDWANETESGDRTEAPPASDETWRQYSSTNAECPGKSVCPFGAECFAEVARDKAREAKIVITNHAIVALDLESDGSLLGDRNVFVFDELHELDTYMSSAWGAELTFRKLDNAYKTLKAIPSIDEKAVEGLKTLMDEFDSTLRSVEKGLIDNEDSSLKLENYLIKLYNVMSTIVQEVSKKEKSSQTDALKRVYTKAKKTAKELHDIARVLIDTSIETVRWTADSAARKRPERKGATKSSKAKATSALKDTSSTMSINAAPLRIGPKLQEKLSERDATMIGLSATVTVMGRGDIPVHNFGLDNKPHKVVVLETPFDYKKQAMLYIPNPKSFPLPVGDTKKDHMEAMKADSAALIKAAGGRSLILSTTTDGVTEYATYYRKKLPNMTFLAQGDGPNSQLVSEFKKNEESCLIGTMGFWHGLDAPGKTLTLDIIDKIPFPTPDDPLLAARKNYADKLGRNGFMEIYVTIADWMLRQGFGRAIRSKSDRAVIAIYDPRLIMKNYGRAIMQNFHGVGLYHDHAKVEAAIKRLVASY